MSLARKVSNISDIKLMKVSSNKLALSIEYLYHSSPKRVANAEAFKQFIMM